MPPIRAPGSVLASCYKKCLAWCYYPVLQKKCYGKRTTSNIPSNGTTPHPTSTGVTKNIRAGVTKKKSRLIASRSLDRTEPANNLSLGHFLPSRPSAPAVSAPAVKRRPEAHGASLQAPPLMGIARSLRSPRRRTRLSGAPLGSPRDGIPRDEPP